MFDPDLQDHQALLSNIWMETTPLQLLYLPVLTGRPCLGTKRHVFPMFSGSTGARLVERCLQMLTCAGAALHVRTNAIINC